VKICLGLEAGCETSNLCRDLIFHDLPPVDLAPHLLALLLIRIAEVETQTTWPKIRRCMQRLNLVEFLTKDGRILQHTEITSDQRNILKKLKIKRPKSVLKVDLAT